MCFLLHSGVVFLNLIGRLPKLAQIKIALRQQVGGTLQEKKMKLGCLQVVSQVGVIHFRKTFENECLVRIQILESFQKSSQENVHPVKKWVLDWIASVT